MPPAYMYLQVEPLLTPQSSGDSSLIDTKVEQTGGKITIEMEAIELRTQPVA
jgi:hypothetical protein